VFFFLALMVVTILVLTIACANVAGLLLARSTARRREIAIRFAVGATRGRLVQQLLTEGIVLSLSGVGVGLLLTVGAGTIFRTVSLPLPLPIEFDVDVTGRLIWLAAGLVVVSALLSALTPALHATQPGVTPALKQQVTAYAHRRFTMRGLIVCGQVAVSLVLLIVTLLFARNLTMANALAPGFDVDRLVVADVAFVEGRQGTQADPAIAPIVDRLGAIPGVEGAAFASSIPLTPTGINRVGMRLTIEGHAEKIPVDYSGNRVGPGFFRTMGIPIRRGREFLPTDRPGSPLVIVISEEFARRYFAGMDPIGRRVHIPTARDAETPAEVIGIAGDGKYRSLGEGKQPAIYEAYVQRRGAERRTNVVVRTAGPPAAAVAAVRAMMLQMDPSAAVHVQPMTAALSFAFLPSQIGAALMGSLGVLGVVLAMVGLYGVIAFNAGRRAPEIAVRMALGATRGSVLRLVLADTGWLAGVGMAVGVALAMAATPLLTAFLVADLSASDPLSFALALLLLGATSLAAAWRPARRSMRIEPAAVLRSE
jgi:predicted permease